MKINKLKTIVAITCSAMLFAGSLTSIAVPCVKAVYDGASCGPDRTPTCPSCIAIDCGHWQSCISGTEYGTCNAYPQKKECKGQIGTCGFGGLGCSNFGPWPGGWSNWCDFADTTGCDH